MHGGRARGRRVGAVPQISNHNGLSDVSLIKDHQYFVTDIQL
jgi:hypothetical protein